MGIWQNFFVGTTCPHGWKDLSISSKVNFCTKIGDFLTCRDSYSDLWQSESKIGRFDPTIEGLKVS
jgi:hypothetical protein